MKDLTGVFNNTHFLSTLFAKVWEINCDPNVVILRRKIHAKYIQTFFSTHSNEYTEI